MFFRYGFYQLGQGVHPSEERWIDPTPNQYGTPSGEFQKITNNIKESAVLHNTLADADLTQLAADCRFPDFLGYLGLGLFFTETTERSQPLLTSCWVPQLIPMVSPQSQADDLLRKISMDSSRRLSWHDLEVVERDYLR